MINFVAYFVIFIILCFAAIGIAFVINRIWLIHNANKRIKALKDRNGVERR